MWIPVSFPNAPCLSFQGVVEEGRGRASASKEASGPQHATVVRTESHLARFNTARALFEKMGQSEGGIGQPPRAAPASAALSARVPPPAGFGGKVGAGLAKGEGEAKKAGAAVSRVGAAAHPFGRRSGSEERPGGLGSRTFKSDLTAELRRAARPEKPEKPAKPESLDRRASTHEQHQELIARHKNWFQSFSKSRSSPTASPSKPDYRPTSPSKAAEWEQRPPSPSKADGRGLQPSKTDLRSPRGAETNEEAAMAEKKEEEGRGGGGGGGGGKGLVSEQDAWSSVLQSRYGTKAKDILSPSHCFRGHPERPSPWPLRPRVPWTRCARRSRLASRAARAAHTAGGGAALEARRMLVLAGRAREQHE
ncbi:hypothetical protein C7M84_015464 [Penaeus vannamei]|uniref:Uncharacterized protein n=1 Tax=Penaeus vannamei TaxID=6689 RepID=A0A3R7QGC6_PENVA|nr:hypothetical protein C7M84_015464 [Penaeus vannamei]